MIRNSVNYRRIVAIKNTPVWNSSSSPAIPGSQKADRPKQLFAQVHDVSLLKPYRYITENAV